MIHPLFCKKDNFFMFRPLSIYLGLKYTRARSRNHFISFISWVSILGIALGVMVLITVLSVMNGFDREIKTRILNLVPQVTIASWDGNLSNWTSFLPLIKTNPDIQKAAPFIETQAMINTTGSPNFGVLKGIDPTLESSVSPISNCMKEGDLLDLKPGGFGIILGEDLATSLGVGVGDKVTVITPKTSLSAVGLLPRIKVFQVVGIFETGYQFDSSYGLTNIQDLAKVLQMPENMITGIQLKLKDLYQAPSVVEWLQDKLPMGDHAFDWTSQNQNFFDALKMEKVMMFLILLLIIAVAAFNMLSQLVMMVTDKESDIAILRTLGAESGLVTRIFMIQGIITGAFGTFLGVIFGVILSLNVTRIVNLIQTIFHIQFLSSSVYYIDFVPSYLRWQDILIISLISLLISILATIYPALRAARILPAEALRHE